MRRQLDGDGSDREARPCGRLPAERLPQPDERASKPCGGAV